MGRPWDGLRCSKSPMVTGLGTAGHLISPRVGERNFESPVRQVLHGAIQLSQLFPEFPTFRSLSPSGSQFFPLIPAFSHNFPLVPVQALTPIAGVSAPGQSSKIGRLTGSALCQPLKRTITLQTLACQRVNPSNAPARKNKHHGWNPRVGRRRVLVICNPAIRQPRQPSTSSD